MKESRDSGPRRVYSVCVYGEDVTVATNMDLKSRYWEACKCHFPTFEVTDCDTNEVFVFNTARIDYVKYCFAQDA